MEIKKVCVVGSGIMGGGIAQVSAQAGYNVIMVDVKQEYLDKGLGGIKNSLGRFVKKGTMNQADADKILAKIHTSTDLEDAAKDADCVIEAVFERAEVKLPVFQQLEEVCPEQAILASNTSGIPISLLASATKRPDKVVGMHFMNPVPMMKGVEVIKSLLTSEETLEASVGFVKSLGKEPVVVADSPGFVVNRIGAVMWNEAAKVLGENLATIEDIDKITELSFGWPLGPFRLLDLLGIDVVTDFLEGVYQQTGWERYKPAPVLKRMVEIGYFGRKVGKGFYEVFGKK